MRGSTCHLRKIKVNGTISLVRGVNLPRGGPYELVILSGGIPRVSLCCRPVGKSDVTRIDQTS